MANSNCKCRDFELIEKGKVEKDCPHVAYFACRDCGKFKKWVGRKEYNEWKNLKILEEKKKQQQPLPQPPSFISVDFVKKDDNNNDNENSPTQLYYSTNKVAEILTFINKDVCKSINDYFDRKFKETMQTYDYTDINMGDIIDIINSVFICHKNEIIKEVEK